MPRRRGWRIGLLLLAAGAAGCRPTAGSRLGAGCRSAEDCGGALRCLTEVEGGLCVAPCAGGVRCPPEGDCVASLYGGMCARHCATDADCGRERFGCLPAGAAGAVCLPDADRDGRPDLPAAACGSGAPLCDDCPYDPEPCDDANPCTADACTAEGCRRSFVASACDDGDRCTVEDACREGVCAGRPGCDDGNGCTGDACDPATGACSHLFNRGPCDDGIACTRFDACVEGRCIGEALSCDDGDLCTVDECDEATGGCGHRFVGDCWRPMSLDGAPVAGQCSSAVWTGREMLVWGHCAENGTTIDGVPAVPRPEGEGSPGGAYDPETDRWRPINVDFPREATVWVSVWSGSELFGYGTLRDPYVVHTGIRYDPVSDRWSVIPFSEGWAGQAGSAAYWTGTEALFVYGRRSCSADWPVCGVAYNPATNSGRQILGPHQRSGALSVWTGSELIVWSGDPIHDLSIEEWFAWWEETTTDEGWIYNPTADTWRPMRREGSPAPRVQYSSIAVWTGSRMLVWGPDGGTYDPASDTWQRLDATDIFGRCVAWVTDGIVGTAVWAGNVLFVYEHGIVAPYPECEGLGHELLLYYPDHDLWVRASAEGAPPGVEFPNRLYLKTVWTGEAILVFGWAVWQSEEGERLGSNPVGAIYYPPVDVPFDRALRPP